MALCAIHSPTRRGTSLATPPAMRKRLATKKILIASLGVGAVSYVAACGSSSVTPGSGNLLPPTAVDSGSDAAPVIPDAAPDVVTSGNLMAPTIDSGSDASHEDGGLSDASGDADVADVSVGNLVPPPVDSGK